MHIHTGHTVVFTDDKEVWSWGRGDDGRLVREGVKKGGKERYMEPWPVLADFSFFFSRSPFTPPFLPQGHADNHWKYVPHLVSALSGKSIKQVTCGSYHTVRTFGKEEKRKGQKNKTEEK